MGRPLILYGLLDLANPSFEADDATDAPSSWDTSLSVNADQEVDASVVHSAGDGIPSLRSLRQNVTDATAGNKAIAAQRFAIADFPPYTAVHAEGQEFAAAAMLYPQGQTASDNSLLELRFFNGGTLTVGSGTEVTDVETRVLESGFGPWYLRVYAVRVGATATVTHVEVRLVYDIAQDGFSATAHAYWDRVFVGGLFDPSKGVRGDARIQPEKGTSVNEGDGAAEIVRVRKPRTRIDLAFTNFPRGSTDYAQAAALDRFLGAGEGFCAIWRDRDYFTNGEQHFQKCFLDDRRGVDVSLPAGFVRKTYAYRFEAPSEDG